VIPSRDGRVIVDLDYNGAPTIDDDLDVRHVEGDLGLPLCGADAGDEFVPSGAAFECPECAALSAADGLDDEEGA
jgi:hypothetical protein